MKNLIKKKFKKKKIQKNQNLKMSIHLIIPYFGSFPNYFQLYLDSLSNNVDILTVHFFTDIDISSYNISENAKFTKMTIVEMREKIAEMLRKEFVSYANKEIIAENLLPTNYKLVDFKISYPLLFKDYLTEQGVRENIDFVGYGDIDLIYGKFSNFLDPSNNEFDILGGFHGHLTAFRNTEAFRLLFKSVPNIFELMMDEKKTHITDEIAFREPLLQFIEKEKLKMFYINRYFTDVVPSCFYEMFRKEWQLKGKNFFDVYNPTKNIKHIFYNGKTKKLTTFYDDGTDRETIYCHLQKRKMEMSQDFLERNMNKQDEGGDGSGCGSGSYYIYENEFLENRKLIRLHLPAIPYTITRDEFSVCAFTGKTQRFSKIMGNHPDFEVYHYCVETSVSNATKDIILFTKEEWQHYRILSVMFLKKEITSEEEAIAYLNDPKFIHNDLSNWDTPLFIEYNRRFKLKLEKNYRSERTDIVTIPLGHSYDRALNSMNVVQIEIGVGYANSCKDFRVFESYAWMHRTMAVDNFKGTPNYWFVIPYTHDVSEFAFAKTPTSKKPIIGFLGRVGYDKGCHVIVDIAKRFPEIEFVLCGPGDSSPFLILPNITHKLAIHGKERSDFLGSLTAMLAPTNYMEPFGASMIESQLCGTPVITVDNGGMVETVENFKSGLRCHTLADFCLGVQMALDNKFDRSYIRDRAVSLYDMNGVTGQYAYVFKSVLDIYKQEENGWCSPYTHLTEMFYNNN